MQDMQNHDNEHITDILTSDQSSTVSNNFNK